MIGKFLAPLHRPIYARRLEVLVALISPHVRESDRMIDVGCGSGELGAAVRRANSSKNVVVHGLENHPRGNEPIETFAYAGKQFPFPDNSYDVVIIADVLHHEPEPGLLLREAVRVSRRLIVIKDHQISGPLAYPRICLIDWAANAPYGVPCLYRYNTPQQWNECLARFNLRPFTRLDTIDLYPAIVNLLFGRRLQFFVVAEVR